MNSENPQSIEAQYKEEKRLLYARAQQAMQQGVKIRNPERIDIRGELICGQGVEIDINVIIEGKVQLGDNVRVGANCILINAEIGSGSTINPFSLVEDAVVGEQSFVGPYGRVRPNSRLGDHVQIGNFVEIKNANVSSGSRINHLAFVGDADLGERVTLGAGTITCNHDGVGVNHMSIDEGAFVGSGCNLVAPVRIGANATIASGSTITEEVPADKLTLARSRQVTVDNWAGPKHRRNSED